MNEEDILCLAYLPKETRFLRPHWLPNIPWIDLKFSTKFDRQMKKINKFHFVPVSWKQMVKAVKKRPV